MPHSFTSQPNGPVRLWQKPQKGLRYTIGIDTASGDSTDWTVGQVLCNSLPFEQVAMFRAKIGITEAAEELDALGRYYNDALAVIETNGMGVAMQDAFLMKHKYPKCYRAEQRLDEDPDISPKFGFNMSKPAKNLLIGEMSAALKNEEVVIHDVTTLNELMTFVWQEGKQKASAAEGSNDDCVIALMLALHGCTLFPQKHKKIESRAVVDPDKAMFRRIMAEFMQEVADYKETTIIV